VNGLGPRINIYEEISFDYWNETAITTAETGPSKDSGFTTAKKPVTRTLVEPNQKTEVGF
jgi:hypothetical protein